MNINELENQNIDEILKTKEFIILDFFTKWCPSCRMVAMTLEEFEEAHDDVLIIEIDANEYKSLADIYKVRTAPTLLFFNKGELKNTHSGFIDVDELENILLEISK